MSAELQARARAFLQRPIPEGIGYVPDSMAERFMAQYAQAGSLPDDDEAIELLGLAGRESSAMVEQLTDPMASAYFRESFAILEAMLAERV